jgi:AraC-like DNA-binding protein
MKGPGIAVSLGPVEIDGRWQEIRAVAAERAPTLTAHTLAVTDGLEVSLVDCAGAGSEWAAPEVAGGPAIVFVRRGLFVRRARGAESLIDPTMAYFQRPGEEERFAHPAGGGDQCLSLRGPALMATVGVGPEDLPGSPIGIGPGGHLAHRLLAHKASLGSDGFEVHERAATLVSAVLDGRDGQDRDDLGRPGTSAARHRLVNRTREALMAAPSMGLVELSRAVGSSPHHLSRVFRAEMGQTLTAYRNGLRTALALERLDRGERDLTGLAADLGFADHAHMTRVIGEQLGEPPSRLRSMLAGAN